MPLQAFEQPISVIIPTYNRRHLIGRALDSVLAQTRQPEEILVVDDGSSDGTAEMVADRYPRCRILRQPNRGLSAARNAGIAAATGSHIAFLDTDDVWLPGKLQAQMRVLADRPELGLLATQKYKDRRDFPLDPLARPRVRSFPFGVFLKRTWFHPSSVVIPRRIFTEVGGFDEILSAAEDWDMWARIAYRHPVARIEQPLVAVFESEDSISKNRRRQYRNDLEVLAKWNPAAPQTLDARGRISPQAYERYILTFTILRGLRLQRYLGKEAVREFITMAEDKLKPAPFTRALIRGTLKIIT